MNTKKSIAIILILMSLGGIMYFNWTVQKNTKTITDQNKNEIIENNKQKTDDENQNDKDVDSNQLNFQANTYESPNGNFLFKYPKNWHLTESITDPQENAGVFGNVQSAWNVSSFNPNDTLDRGGIPTDSIKIDFEVSIPKDGLDIETVAQCENSETKCETRNINGLDFTRASTEGGQLPSVLYVTITNSMMYRASAIFGSEIESNNLKESIKVFDEIASTFRIIRDQ